LLREYQAILPDLSEEDITGSPFAVYPYTVHADFGGEKALKRLRKRLHARGLRLMLDFVPNHTAPDHEWVRTHPEYYIQGEPEDLQREPQNYVRVETARGARVLAYGRDPYFPGWTDTLQLNYGNEKLQAAMMDKLLRIAAICDGVRCDMAMLVLPQIFQQTWSIAMLPFWPRAISKVHDKYPDFTFLAEVYWDLEWELLQQGFDYTYDKRLYDRLRELNSTGVRLHLKTDTAYQQHMVRFLENHDEGRAAAVFAPGVHQAAAVLTFLSPGMRFFHQGQLEGRTRRIPVQLRRRPVEPVDSELQTFYTRLLKVLQRAAVREGEWRLLESAPAWQGQIGWEHFIAYLWTSPGGDRLLVIVNYSPEQGQCYIQIPSPEGTSHVPQPEFVQLKDTLSDIVYEREAVRLYSQGLYLDLPGWGLHVFEVI
jgi:hypothetical protein